jgi:surfeit locus 1 family protein
VSPRLRFVVVTVGALAASAVTLSLGLWQLSRAGDKLAQQAAQARQAKLPVLNAQALASAADPHALLHRQVVLQGRWLAAATVFLENRQMNAKPGFFVLTPLKTEAPGPAVLVLRGWAPRNFQQRALLPPVATPDGLVEVRGVLAASPSRLYEFADAGAGPIRQNLDLASYSKELGQPLFALAVRQLGDGGEGGASGAGGADTDGLLRQWPPVDLGAEKHHGYALQWFALSALVACLYVWFQIVRPLRSRH